MPFRWSGLDCLILAGLVHISWVNWQMGWRLAGLEWLWMWYFMHLLLLWWTSPGLFSWQNRSLREEAEPCRIQLASGCSCLVGLSKWYGLGATYKRGETQGSSKAWGQQCSQPTTGSISALPPDSRDLEKTSVFSSAPSGRDAMRLKWDKCILGLWHHVYGGCPAWLTWCLKDEHPKIGIAGLFVRVENQKLPKCS